MTTRDTSFVADGRLSALGSYPIGFYANSTARRPPTSPFKAGVLAVGQEAGVYGATNDVILPPPTKPLPRGSFLQNAGVWGFSRGACGVAGYSDDYVGVSGESKGGPGVAALSQASYGVLAQSSTFYGVFAGSGTNSGVVGTTALTQQVALIPNAVGVFSTAGILGVAGAQGPQVWQGPNVGKNINPPIAGVYGTSDLGPGVIGTSKAAIGIYGFSSGNAGVVGETIDGFAGGYFACTNPQHWAGYFDGNVHITGNLTVAGPMKGAVVPFPDGTQRVLLCMESPEAWFEDFGSGKLKRGRAVVKIDGDFAKVIKRGDYHVFLTPRGDCRGLYVRRQSGTSFEMRELAGGTSSAAFSYRIVARRKDVKGHRRFAKIDTRLPIPPARPARRRGAKMPPSTPAGLRAFAARMEKAARAQMRKRGRKGGRS
jgi:hypothetical protein